MAEKDEMAVTPEMTVAAGKNLRRGSMGRSLSSSNSGEKLLPHYLRASTGSCHDFCKYGRKHAFEAKGRHPMPKNLTTKSFEGKKTPLTQEKAKFSSNSRLSGAEATIFTGREVLTKSPICPTPMQREAMDEKKKKLLVKSRPLQTTSAPKILKQEPSSTGTPEISVKQVFSKGMERMLTEKRDKISRSKSMKVKPLRSAGSLSYSRRNDDSKMGNSVGTKAPKKVSSSSDSVQRVANSTARKYSNLKAVPLKNHHKIRRSEHGKVWSEEVQEKTLYVIKIENEEKPQQTDQTDTDDDMEAVPLSPKLSSKPNSLSFWHREEDDDGSEYTESEAEDDSYTEGYESDNMEAGKTSTGGSKGGSQNLGMLQSNEKDPQSIKLNFKRGKIIDINAANNSPRRLKFRHGRLLGENPEVMVDQRKNFKKGKEVDSDTIATETASETVVLRHQDVQGKKDAQGLFNNVIEETASKLVETRKSKVKALVGAFETVISLQDSKPSLDPVT